MAAPGCLQRNDWICGDYLTSRQDVIVEATVQHLVLTGVSVTIGLLLALPLGVLAFRSPRARSLVLGASTSLDDALLAMQRDRLHVAVVTDDAGRTLGIATLEDVIEPYLIQEGLMLRTSRGRMLGEPGWRHLGLTPPSVVPGQRGLLDLLTDPQ